MIEIPKRTTSALDRQTVLSLNSRHIGAVDRTNVLSLNRRKEEQECYGQRRDVYGAGNTAQSRSQPLPRTVPDAGNPSAPSPVRSSTVTVSPSILQMKVPPLVRPLRKGQKTAVFSAGNSVNRIDVRFGWNLKDARCDMDASVFLVGGNGRVRDDSWFVFYGQEESPDRSVRFQGTTNDGKDREVINLDLARLNLSVQKLVFVLTINEAFEQHLNFSMVKDAYVRLMDAATGQELVSFLLDEYYENVTSMTIGELYLHNGQWKFNPVGNGVNRDLAGQCAIYGVQIE